MHTVSLTCKTLLKQQESLWNNNEEGLIWMCLLQLITFASNYNMARHPPSIQS